LIFSSRANSVQRGQWGELSSQIQISQATLSELPTVAKDKLLIMQVTRYVSGKIVEML